MSAGEAGEQRARPGRPARARVERGAQRLKVTRRVDVELERGRVRDPDPRPGCVASAAWRAKEPGPNAGPTTVGGSISSAFVPEPWRSGTITTPGPAVSSSVATSSGSSAGQSPGTSSTRCAPRATAARTPRAAADDCPASSGSCTTSMSSPTHLGRDHDHAVEPAHGPQRLDHVPGHRLGQRTPLDALHRAAEPLLGPAEGLDGEDGQRAHRGADLIRAGRRRTPGSPARRGDGRSRRPSRRRSRASAPRSRARR